MKKLLLLTLTVLVQTTLTFSQTINKSNISISIGPAFSTGHFANTDLNDQSSGFAKTGEAISLSYAKPVAKNWALLVNLSGQRNPINTKAFESSFSKAKIYEAAFFGTDPNTPPPQTTYTIYPNWKFESNSWLFAALQVGAKAQFPLNKENRAWLSTSATLGGLYAASPQLKGNSTSDTASAIIIQKKNSGFGLIYSFGVGLNYALNKKIFLTSTLNYTGTNNITFKNVKSIVTTTKGTPGTLEYSIQQGQTTGNGKQTISSVNLLIGFGINL